MKLVFGTLGIALAVLAYCIVLLGVRNPRRSWWASDMWVGNVHCILIIGLGLVGILVAGSALITSAGQLAPVHFLLSGAIAAGLVILVKAMRIKARLAEYEKRASGAGPSVQAHRGQLRPSGGIPDGPKMAA